MTDLKMKDLYGRLASIRQNRTDTTKEAFLNGPVVANFCGTDVVLTPDNFQIEDDGKMVFSLELAEAREKTEKNDPTTQELLKSIEDETAFLLWFFRNGCLDFYDSEEMECQYTKETGKDVPVNYRVDREEDED